MRPLRRQERDPPRGRPHRRPPRRPVDGGDRRPALPQRREDPDRGGLRLPAAGGRRGERLRRPHRRPDRPRPGGGAREGLRDLRRRHGRGPRRLPPGPGAPQCLHRLGRQPAPRRDRRDRDHLRRPGELGGRRRAPDHPHHRLAALRPRGPSRGRPARRRAGQPGALAGGALRHDAAGRGRLRRRDPRGRLPQPRRPHEPARRRRHRRAVAYRGGAGPRLRAPGGAGGAPPPAPPARTTAPAS